MGKKAQLRRKKIEDLRKEKKELREKIYNEKNPWLKFWKRVDFWVYSVCFVAIVAYPFTPMAKVVPESHAVIQTSMGSIEVELYTKDAPKTTDNFKKLAKAGFYDDLLWHRVIKGFMIQGGDPNGDGTGGPGYQFEDEINSHKVIPGALAMANSGPNTNGSQFFIVTDQPQPHLDGKHTVFGQVTKGMDVVKTIAEAPVDENDKPLAPITIKKIIIE